jgi:hypothetical protein
VITSIDFAKRKDVTPSLDAAHFDLVIVDEAHKMAAYKYGDKTHKTARYRLGETLSRISEHYLFLTATPHKGDRENYRLFLDLLEPGFFATAEMVEESIRCKDNPLFIRRIKEELKDFDGAPLFLPRNVETIAFRLKAGSPAEMELYNELSRYVSEQYGEALKKNRNVAFALIILQRRLASSTYALLKSLKRRKKRLEDLLNNANSSPARLDNDNFDFEAIDDINEDERWKLEEQLEVLSTAESKEQLKREIDTLERLIAMAGDIIRGETEKKLGELKSALQRLHDNSPGRAIRKSSFLPNPATHWNILRKKPGHGDIRP